MERRIDLALKAPDVAALDALLADLAPEPASRAGLRSLPESPAPVRPRGIRGTMAVMSGTRRRGRWLPAPRHTGVAFMGGFSLDFRDAELPPGTTEVRLYVMWGGMDVIVPPDLDVEVDGVAIMGN